MKKRVLAVVLALAMTTVGLAGCGGSGSETAKEETVAKETEAPEEEQEESEAPSQEVEIDEESQAEGDTVTVTDLAGREVTVNLPVESAYLGFFYENFLTVVGPDAFTKVKATSLYDTEGYFATLSKLYRENVEGYTDMVDIGSTMQDDFDLEKLIELDCDVAIMGKYQYDAITDKVDLLEQAGIPVVVINYSTCIEEDTIQSTEILGKVFQVEDRANKIVDTYREKRDSVNERIAAITEKKTTFHEYDSTLTAYSEVGLSNFSGYGMGTYLYEGGADDIADALKESTDGTGTTLDMEYILEKDPDAWFVIGGEAADSEKDGLLMGYGVTEDELLASAEGMISSRPGWENMKAVKDQQIYCVENSLLRTLKDYIVIEYIAKSLYPEEFEDLDPEKELLEYSKEYLPQLPTDGIFFYHYVPEA